MKGISTIIASILLLVITIGLAATAYLFISGMLLQSISKIISILDASCLPFSPTQGNITLILSNDGTMNITDSEIIILIDGQVKSNDFDFNQPTMPHNSVLNTSKSGYSTGTYHTVVVASPSNSVRVNVWC
jgi:FlaG/FlaF family flagellin (archaellin)